MRASSSCRRPRQARAMIEAIEAGVPLVVCVTERVPVLDMVQGPAGAARVGDDAGRAQFAGHTVARQMQGRRHVDGRRAAGPDRDRLALGVADERDRCADKRGRPRPVHYGRHRRPTRSTASDSSIACGSSWTTTETEALVLIGEIGGNEEEMAAEYLRRCKAAQAGGRAGRRAPCARASAAWAMQALSPRSARATQPPRSRRCGEPESHIAEDATRVTQTVRQALLEKAA